MAPMKTEPTAGMIFHRRVLVFCSLLTYLGGVDLGLVMDEISFSQGVSPWCFSWCTTIELTRLTDFGLWFGKSVFEGILAEIFHKERSGHTAVTLVVCEAICSHISSHTLTIYKDVLELMVAVYCPDVTGASKEKINPQQTHEAFYRSIHDRRCDTSDADWEAFRQGLSFDIATSCRRLRDEKVPEHGISLSTESKTSMVPTPTIDASNGASSSSSSSFSSSPPSSAPSPVSSQQQHSAKSLSGTSGAAQSQPVLQPLANPASAPRVAVDMHRYTSVLNEHAALQGESLAYEKRQLSLSPSSWQCTAILGDISRVGTGRNITKAKHEASKQICELIGLMVL
jgi:hypothetical protein